MTAQPTTEQLRAELAQLQQEHETFRQLARDRAIKGFHDGQWTAEALNDTLTDLGLQPHEPQLVSSFDANFAFQVEARTGDEHGDHQLIHRLRDKYVVDAMRAALSAAIAEHLAGAPLTVTEQESQPYIGYATVRWV
ncbi:hypothetical protein [Amycolatopsis thermoflava]|uniref:hypothetical protein n=1 Tax=Amycolatopsis thermoflava TaxID=84480 RepID=UPI0037F5A024